MSAPTISPITSIQDWKQFEFREFQPFASGTNHPWTWAVSSLPAGVSIDSPVIYAATGAAATDLVTAVGNTFANGDAVYFRTLTGGAGLVVTTIYYVRDHAGDAFKLAASPGAAAIDITSDITASTIQREGTGRISGSPTTNGTFNLGLTVTNSLNETSTPLVFPIGIEPAAGASNSAAVELTWDLATNLVTGTGADGAPPPVKFNDTRLVYLFLKKGSTPVDPGTLDELKIYVKRSDTESLLAESGAWEKVAGASPYFRIFLPFTLEVLKAALEENNKEPESTGTEVADDTETNFTPLAEVSFTKSETVNAVAGDVTVTSANFKWDVFLELA